MMMIVVAQAFKIICLALSPRGPPHCDMGGCVVAHVGAMWDIFWIEREIKQEAFEKKLYRSTPTFSLDSLQHFRHHHHHQ